ncbi:MAG TPA: sulfite exporter TauE/SafE family protein, partial [Actinomycetota bacterium]
MTDVLIAVLIGLVSGILSGLFGVGGGIVMTPGIQVLLGTAPIVALATPLPVILPTAIAGA